MTAALSVVASVGGGAAFAASRHESRHISPHKKVTGQGSVSCSGVTGTISFNPASSPKRDGEVGRWLVVR
jgi:hypothetical protein